MPLAFSLISALLVLLFVVVVLLAVLFYTRRRDCFTHPSPWCYNDWQCADGTDPVGDFQASVDRCSGATGATGGTGCPCAWSSFYDPNNVEMNPSGRANYCTP